MQFKDPKTDALVNASREYSRSCERLKAAEQASFTANMANERALAELRAAEKDYTRTYDAVCEAGLVVSTFQKKKSAKK